MKVPAIPVNKVVTVLCDKVLSIYVEQDEEQHQFSQQCSFFNCALPIYLICPEGVSSTEHGSK